MSKVIIFDLDGVIFDSVKLMHDFSMASYKDMTDEEVRDMHKGNIHESINALKHRAIEETDEELAERMRVYTKNKMGVPMYDGIKEVLVKLHTTNHLVINTSATRGNCIPLLERDGILDLFTFIASKELGSSKVEKFKHIADRFNVKPEEMVFITDTIGDIREAFMAKVPTVAVTWGIHKREDFDTEPLDSIVVTVDTPEELERFLIGN